ncbi:hypothetical protein HW555_006532 [Spodoptera exigua]|uniref:Uncharacterized protein n=1 Tax=Spodoptera exigua TaxID=7107 RepID=A0A835GGW3_SPOEX|nr:hypothetical protein HW555_006532 [Spodoptera exigua]
MREKSGHVLNNMQVFFVFVNKIKTDVKSFLHFSVFKVIILKLETQKGGQHMQDLNLRPSRFNHVRDALHHPTELMCQALNWGIFTAQSSVNPPQGEPCRTASPVKEKFFELNRLQPDLSNITVNPFSTAVFTDRRFVCKLDGSLLEDFLELEELQELQELLLLVELLRGRMESIATTLPVKRIEIMKF